METMEASMAKKQTASALVDGMFMGAALLKSLADKVIEKGGHSEQLHFLTTEAGEETLEKLAEIIVLSEWRIPRSLMEKLVLSSGEVCPGDQWYWWDKVLNDSVHHLKVPVRYFDHRERREIGAETVPRELLNQLRGLTFEEKPLIVTLDDEEYIIVEIMTNLGTLTGRSGISEDDLGYVNLAPAKYFDLTR